MCSRDFGIGDDRLQRLLHLVREARREFPGKRQARDVLELRAQRRCLRLGTAPFLHRLHALVMTNLEGLHADAIEAEDHHDQRAEGGEPRCTRLPPRRQHGKFDRDGRGTPDAILVAGLQEESMIARGGRREGGEALPADVHPVTVDAVDAVAEPQALGIAQGHGAEVQSHPGRAGGDLHHAVERQATFVGEDAIHAYPWREPVERETVGVDADHAVDRAEPHPAGLVGEARRHPEVRLLHAALRAQDDRREHAPRPCQHLRDLRAIQHGSAAVGRQPQSPVPIVEES